MTTLGWEYVPSPITVFPSTVTCPISRVPAPSVEIEKHPGPIQSLHEIHDDYAREFHDSR